MSYETQQIYSKYNHTTFWALFGLVKQILSQVCSLNVLSGQSDLLLTGGTTLGKN
jgi:hypothetical protein